MNRISSGTQILRKKAFSVLTMTLVVLCFIRFGIDGGANSQDCIPENKLLVLMDFSSLSCSLCVKSLTEFVGAIHENRLEDSVFGVMILEEREEETDVERYRKIAQIRLKGFVRGNNIRFPFLLDEEGVFRPLNQGSSATLIVLNIQKRTVEKYEFPLSKSQLTSILK